MTQVRIEVLAIGDELLDGRVADTNTLKLATALQPFGLEIRQRTTVRDVTADIVREARAVAARGTTTCVVSGGLGPTTDDLTAEAFAHLCGVAVERDPETAARIKALVESRGRTLNANQLRMADRPAGSQKLDNPAGTAPGFAVTFGGCRFVSLPGVPREFEAMLPAVVAPLTAGSKPLCRRVLRCFGTVESEVDRRLLPLTRSDSPVRVGYRAKFPEVHVSLTTEAEHQAAFDDALAFVRKELAELTYGDGDAPLAAVLVDLLREKRATLATAESCTGGLVADLVTDVPGSSDVFLGGVAAYANAAKTELLGVSTAALDRDGAVSEATVRAMAEGARARFGSTFAVSVSGIAGPTGGTPDKPVGTVWLGLAGPNGTSAKKLQLWFDRRGNKVASAYAALDLVRRAVLEL
jgi:nicotinamide-nucleotide amidase